MFHGPGVAGRRVRAVGRAGAAAEDRGDAVAERRPDLLRRDHVDVAVDAAGRGDQALAGDDLGPGADHQPVGDAVHDVRVAGLADTDDAAVVDADVGLDDADQGIEDDGVRDDQVERAGGVREARRLGHPVPDGLAAAEDRLVAGHGQVALDLADEVRVGQTGTGRPSSARRARRSAAARSASRLSPSRRGRAGSRELATRRRTPRGRPVGRARRPPVRDQPVRTRFPAYGTRSTSRVSPGSNRTAVPAGRSSRWPYAARRSNRRARLASAKW